MTTRIALAVALGCVWTSVGNAADITVPGGAAAQAGRFRSLFDGKSLDGWIQEPLAPTTFSSSDIADYPALAKKLSEKSDPVSAFIGGQLDEAGQAALAGVTTVDAAAQRTAKSALVRNLNRIVNGPNIYDEARFQSIQLRSQTQQLRKDNPQDKAPARLNRMLLEDAYASLIKPSPASSWIVKDGAMASTGAGRGVIYTKDDFTKYRLMFTMRQVQGDHQPCILIFGTRPKEGEKPLDALGAIQFQAPNGGHWDYRPGKNKAGDGFTRPAERPRFDNKQWFRVELLVDATKGTARMAVAHPEGSKAIEVLSYNVPEAGKTGPISWQMHNGGIFDEFKDVVIEVDPAVNELITVK